MSENKEFDLIIKNIQAVKPKLDGINNIDLGIKDGLIKSMEPNLDTGSSDEIYDGENKLALSLIHI